MTPPKLNADLVFMSLVIPSFNIGRPFCFMDSATNASQTLYAYIETNPIVFISHNIAPRHMIDSEIIIIKAHLAVQLFARWRHFN